MPSFRGDDTIVLQPSDEAVVYVFEFPIKATASAAPGYLPFGTTLASGTITAHIGDDAETDATADLIVSSSNDTDTVSVVLQYPSSNGEGNYHIKFVLTLDNSSVREEDFDRVVAKDR